MSLPTLLTFYVDSLDLSLNMSVAGTLTGAEPGVIEGVDAYAKYYVNTSQMKNAFTFQTDSLDVDDISANDIGYQVEWPASYILNPSHAFVDASAISTDVPSNRLLVKHDFIRHIAHSLFNTHLAVDLFDNEDEMRDDLASLGDTEASSLATKIAEPSVCEMIFKNMVHGDKKRFSTLTQKEGQAEGEPVLYQLPFVAGDVLVFKAKYIPEPTQSDIFDGAPEVLPRVYGIKLVVTDTEITLGAESSDGVNVQPDDETDGVAVSTNNSVLGYSA